jgi:cytochrome P450
VRISSPNSKHCETFASILAQESARVNGGVGGLAASPGRGAPSGRTATSLSGGAETLVEELLRYQAVIQYGLVRRATADIPIGDVVIKAGDWVVCSLASANRDEATCPHADQFDAGRSQVRHLSFGYGVHQCAGQNLARVELQVALGALFRRFPGLRLARPVADLPFRGDAFVYGLRELPVTW